MMEAIDETTPRDILMRKEEGEAGFAGLTTAEVLKMADWAIANPRKWPTVKLKLQHPHWTCRELARELGIGLGTVSEHLMALRRVRGRRTAV